MNLTAFQSLRRGLQLNAGPASSQARRVFEVALREELLASGVFVTLEVGSSDEADHLLVALGSFRADVDQAVVVAAVERAWDTVAFHHWSGHAFLTEDGHVELQAATLDRPNGRYVTFHLVVERSAVLSGAAPVSVMPMQRHSEERRSPALAHSA